ncbi:hypothetical protein H4S07_003927 [Coemansia furcata]|uniref:Uncharacterized protein n=1 Tax=Coemansia furcata TaxID=417177 RepID=A0ACC1LEB0_9FUNG|nr:hypothetical protein H4S07_003927 [Coemansia furcata]
MPEGLHCWVSSDVEKPNSPSLVSAAGCKSVNQGSIDLIEKYEGFVSRLSPDPIGLPTVGYGHLCKSKNCGEVPQKFPLTKASAEQLLRSDIVQFTNCLDAYISNRVRLNPNQWGALVSWAFNVGCANVKGSSLAKRFNKGENLNTVVEQELPKWNRAGGRVVKGLTKRRTAEIKLFKEGISGEAHPNCS